LAFVTAYLRNPTGQMPPYTERVVTDEELADIYAFLLEIGQPPPLESITILNY
jgi:mono/diheme cytochrome c family protein